jgi:hypothetical protein
LTHWDGRAADSSARTTPLLAAPSEPVPADVDCLDGVAAIGFILRDFRPRRTSARVARKEKRPPEGGRFERAESEP